MLFLLVLAVLVSGFTLCHIHPIHSHKLHQYEGQYLYLKSAELGISCFVLAFLLALLFYAITPANLVDWACAFIERNWASNSAQATQMMWLLLVVALLIGSVFILKLTGHFSLWCRFGHWKARLYVISEVIQCTPMKSFLFESSISAKDAYVMVTMRDRKVYVGRVASIGESTETVGMDDDLWFKPLLSGYRDEADLRINFTTDYGDNFPDLDLYLKQKDIVSATPFTWERHNYFSHEGVPQGSLTEAT